MILDQVGNNGTELRGFLDSSEILTQGLSPLSSRDSIAEHTSADMTEDVDSDCFDFYMKSSGSILRESARGSGNKSAKPPIPAGSKTFIQAGGVEFLTVLYEDKKYGSKEDTKLIQNQANWLYISSDGYSAAYGDQEGSFSLASGGGNFFPHNVEGHWNGEVDCVIFAVCSILDINDYNKNVFPKFSNDPGKAWWAARGSASYLLGYNYAAPKALPAAAIINDFLATKGDITSAWMEVNFKHEQWNACAIDSSGYWYIRDVPGLRKIIGPIPPSEW